MRKFMLFFMMLFLVISTFAVTIVSANEYVFPKINTYESGMFTDVSEKNWFESGVSSAYEYGFFLGRGEGKFAPKDPVRISETITLASRIHKLYNEGTSEFEVTVPWYNAYIVYAKEHGIIEQTVGIDVNAYATRGDFAKIIAAAVPDTMLPQINDINHGEVHDLAPTESYADAAYKLYRAGVLSGSDKYASFRPNTNISRAEAATIATRIADPEKRVYFTISVYDENPPVDVMIVSSRYDLIPFGKSIQLEVSLTPEYATGKLSWVSSDPNVVSVDEYGLATAVGMGSAEITVTTYNGLSAVTTVNVTVPPTLKYEKTSNGKGWEVVGVQSDVSEVFGIYIPAEYEGKPVVSVRPGAFMQYSKLAFISVAKNHTYFYVKDGALFSEDRKILICLPPAYNSYVYYVPTGTEGIADYAFSGNNYRLRNVFIPEGVKTLGNRAFAYVNRSLGVYVPNSLNKIGTELTQNSNNIAFYGSNNCFAASYAKKNYIPYGIIVSTISHEIDTEKAVDATLPKSDKLSEVKELDSEINIENILLAPIQLYNYKSGSIVNTCKITDSNSEARIQYWKYWALIVPDANGQTQIDFPMMSGLYGAGYTEEPGYLRAYDRWGNLIGGQHIDGDFAFCYDNAYTLGVYGGKNTVLKTLPIKPVFINTPGELMYDAGYLITNETAEKGYIQYYIIYPHSNYHLEAPDYLHFIYQNQQDVVDGYVESSPKHFSILKLSMYDITNVDKYEENVYIDFQTLEKVYEVSDFECYILSTYDAPDFGEFSYRIFKKTLSKMIGNYFPEDIPVQKVTVYANGNYPLAYFQGGIIELDELCLSNEEALAHEFTHIIDFSIPAIEYVSPSPWNEGRAEAIGVSTTGGNNTFDWSFLSEEDKKDFFRYYYYSTNRYTEYDVGYAFLRFIESEYGADVSARITKRIALLENYEFKQKSENNSKLFLSCVEAETEVGVFDKFVSEVIEPSLAH